MRIHNRVWRWLSLGICAVIFACMVVTPVLADTGTYDIQDYQVKLDPQADGNVRITVTQTWLVESGNIPWVTVGLPNSNFNIVSSGDNVAKIYGDNSGGFTGVHIDLDRTYTVGQTFSVQFTVLQSNLLERKTDLNLWRIAYTPGWYNNSFIDHLRIDLVSPVDTSTYSTLSPLPSATDTNLLTWERFNLVPGQHFSIVVENPDGSFITAPNTVAGANGNSYTTFGDSSFPAGMIVFVIFMAGFVTLIVWAALRAQRNKAKLIAKTAEEMEADPQKKETYEKGFEKYVDEKGLTPDNQGRYYDRSYGNYITPVIWAAILNNRNSNNRWPPTTGYSGGHSSCACACVSCACACACACAGGGAAGCAKKGLHECPDCHQTAKSPDDKV